MQCIELLKGLTTPGVTDLAKGESYRMYVSCINSICKRLDTMGFDIIAHEVKYDELQLLYDAFVNLKYSEFKKLRKVSKNHFKNRSLRGAVE